jgi:hypothetical protein
MLISSASAAAALGFPVELPLDVVLGDPGLVDFLAVFVLVVFQLALLQCRMTGVGQEGA